MKSKLRPKEHTLKMRSKRVHLPFGFRVKPRTLRVFLLTSVVLSFFVVGLPLYLFLFQPAIERNAAPVAPEVSLPEQASSVPAVSSVPPAIVSQIQSPAPAEAEPSIEPEELTLDSILEKYRAATGLNEVNSLLLHGTYFEDGRRFEMKLATKAPNLIRKTLTDANLEMACIFDGQSARIEVAQGDQTVSNALEDVLYRNAIILEGAFLALAGGTLAEVQPDYLWQPDQVYDGRACWTVVSQIPGYPQINHLIDTESHVERVRYLDVPVGEKRHQVSIHFNEFRQQADCLLPHAYTLKVDGATRGEATLTSVQRNPGLMPWMF